MSISWEAVGGISAAINALVVLLAVFYAYSQVREAGLIRNVTLLLSFQERYHSLPARNFRHRLLRGDFGSPDEFDPECLGVNEFHEFWQLHDQLETIGVLVHRGLIEF